MFAGPDGMFLLPFDNTQGGVPLISAEGLWPPVCLKRPGVDESAGGFGYFGWSQYSDNLGFIGGMPYVVYDQQQLVCFDQAGEVLWEYMAGSRVSIRAALDGMHLLVCDQSGSLSCLNSSGQAVWNRKEVQYAHAFGERILLTELSRDLLLCLDWNGNEIWKQKVAYRDQPYVYFVPDLKGDRFLLLRDGVITCHDREGERIWSHHGGGRTMFNMQLAPDGHVFARMSGRDNSNSWFGGRIRDRSGSPWCWLCLDPQGNPVWQSAMVHTNQLAAFPGYDGVLFSSSNSVQGLVVLSPPE
ncbi:PQQ-binding-like beta-propeller repeat protein [bacterium]|nr:PQQ-binding-like beta-propeller repeat protein [bacterium]